MSLTQGTHQLIPHTHTAGNYGGAGAFGQLVRLMLRCLTAIGLIGSHFGPLFEAHGARDGAVAKALLLQL